MDAAARARTWHLLVVEDDEDLLRMLARMLAGFGKVETAADGVEAFSRLMSDEAPLPDLVVTDVMMPRMDGIELARKLKHNTRTSRIPIVMLTAKGRPREVIEGINAGARHYVTKPFKQEELLDKVRRALSGR